MGTSSSSSGKDEGSTFMSMMGRKKAVDFKTFDFEAVDASAIVDKHLQSVRKHNDYRALRTAARQGIPNDELRVIIWRKATKASDKDVKRFKILCDELFSGIDASSFPQFPMFGSKHCTFSTLSVDRKLEAMRILVIAAVEHDSLKYCPKLPYVVEYMLGSCEDPCLVFAMVNAMLITSKRNHWYFRFDFFNFRVFLRILMSIFAANCKKLAEHVEKHGIVVEKIFAEAIATFFTPYLTFDTLIRVLDSFAIEGYKVLFRVAVAMLANASDELLNETELVAFRKTLIRESRKLKPDNISRKAFSIYLTRDKFDQLDKMHREDVRDDMAAAGKGEHVEYVRRWPDLKLLATLDRKEAVKARASERHPLFSQILLSKADFLQLWVWLPPGCHHGDFNRLYAADVDGYALSTLYDKCEDRGNILLLIETTDGHIFGFHLSELEREESEMIPDPDMLAFVLRVPKSRGDARVINEDAVEIKEEELEDDFDPEVKLERRVYDPPFIQFSYLRTESTLELPVEAPEGTGVQSSVRRASLGSLDFDPVHWEHFDRISPTKAAASKSEEDVTVDKYTYTTAAKIHAAKKSLTFGDGTGNALVLDRSLNHGKTEACPALGCPALVGSVRGEFQVKNIEVWNVE
jgi:hypothetical protein